MAVNSIAIIVVVVVVMVMEVRFNIRRSYSIRFFRVNLQKPQGCTKLSYIKILIVYNSIEFCLSFILQLSFKTAQPSLVLPVVHRGKMSCELLR